MLIQQWTASKRKKMSSDQYYTNNLDKVSASESDVADIINYYNGRSPMSSDTEPTDRLKRSLIQFECGTPEHFHSTVKLLAKPQNKSHDVLNAPKSSPLYLRVEEISDDEEMFSDDERIIKRSLIAPGLKNFFNQSLIDGKEDVKAYQVVNKLTEEQVVSAFDLYCG